MVRLKGGMGNQMFQYALGRTLSLRYRVPLVLDIELYKLKNHLTKREYDLDVFNVEGSIAAREEIPIRERNYGNGKFLFDLNEFVRGIVNRRGKEHSFAFDPKILSLGPDAYLDGYWQSPKYFNAIADVIRKDFSLKKPPAENIQKLAEEIKSQNSLCIHVRRGDFVGNKLHEVVVGTEYYTKEVEYIKGRATVDKIYVFSDDIKWCENNLKFQFPTMFIGDEYSGVKAEGNLYLMSLCKNFIIPNSTFSWWGAWLSSNPNKIVIVPKQWFADPAINSSDLIPPEWIRI
jgi:hypothetical protein